jgi:hypothetical protein
MNPAARAAAMAVAACLAAAVVTSGVRRRAAAQTVDVQRARTLVVGTPQGGARADRVDAARTGRAREALPSGGLRIEWRASVGELVEHAPLVDTAGVTYVVGTRGEVGAVGRDGVERWHVPTGAMQPGPAALLSDDAVVFVDAAGEAVAVRDGALRWRLRFGRGDAARPAPLPLDDGGVVVATTQDLAAIDAEGHLRARTTLPEPTTFPLVAALGKVVAIGASGTVWTWTPGAPEPVRAASFGTPIADGAALANGRTLLAVSAGQTQLLAVDLDRPGLGSSATTRAVAPAGLFLGPPAVHGATARLLVTTATTELAVAFDASGTEVSRNVLAMHPPPVAADGGAGALLPPPHTPPLVDDGGRLAFATSDGSVGVVSGGGSEVVADACPVAVATVGRLPAIAGMAPLETGTIVVVCTSGTLLAVRGSQPRPSSPAAAGGR